jgi:hypothetical protein
MNQIAENHKSTIGEVVYQITNWNRFFENNKSRERESCRFVCIPNKQDGAGLARVLSHQNGAAIYGIFHLLVCEVSRQKSPRDGWLTDSGQAPECLKSGQMLSAEVPPEVPPEVPAAEALAGHSDAWTIPVIAARCRRPIAEITEAIEVLTSVNVNWIKALQLVPPKVPPKVPAAGALALPERTKNEEREQRRTNERTNERTTNRDGTGVLGRGGSENGSVDRSVDRSERIAFSKKIGKVELAIVPDGFDPIRSEDELTELCQQILGKDEMAHCGSRWRRRLEKKPDLIRRILAEIHQKRREGKIKVRNPGAMAEDLWNQWK